MLYVVVLLQLKQLAMAEKLPMRAMTRMWQMLLKSLEEVAMAPNAMMAAEMAIIRLTHVADLPSPEELLRKLQNTPAPAPTPPGGGGGGAPAPRAGATSQHTAPQNHTPQTGGGTTAHGGAATALALDTQTSLARFVTFDSVVELIRHHRDVKLLIEVETTLRLVSYRPGRIEFSLTQKAPGDLASRLDARLRGWTGVKWGISVVAESDSPTIAELRDEKRAADEAEVRKNPLVTAVFDAFPKAKIIDIRTPADITAQAAEQALPEVGEEWDPFEDD